MYVLNKLPNRGVVLEKKVVNLYRTSPRRYVGLKKKATLVVITQALRESNTRREEKKLVPVETIIKSYMVMGGHQKGRQPTISWPKGRQKNISKGDIKP